MDSANKLVDIKISKLDKLPSLPAVIQEIIQIIDDPMSSISELEATMSRDPALTLQVLRLANSAYYAIPGGAKTVSKAITFLGYNTLKQIVMTCIMADVLKGITSQHFQIVEFWKHSFGTAVISESLARRMGHINPPELFVCGLVHDMGKIALNMVDRDSFVDTCKFAQENNLSLEEAESKTNSPSHAYWGSVLAKQWRLPLLIQVCVQYHHVFKANMRTGLNDEMNTAVDIVAVANLLTHGLAFGHSGHSKKIGIPKEVMERLRMTANDLGPLIIEAKKKLESLSTFLETVDKA